MASNIRMIAQKAGVSTATVSRVLHKSDKVTPDTSRKVEAVMEEMGLLSEQLVRTAKTDRRVIGVIVTDLSNNFFIKIVDGVETLAAQKGISVFVCNTHEDDRTEITYLRLLKEARVCGIVITPASDDDDSINNEYLNLLRNMKIPIVLVDRDVKYSNVSGVFIDNERGAFEATRLLLENGHEKIAAISGPQNTTPGRGRLEGYRSAFASEQKECDESIIFTGDFSMESGVEITRRILAEHPEVTAIFPMNNLMTLGCVSELYRQNICIPEDIAVVGFDELEMLSALDINLTVVDRPTKEMGFQAAKLLIHEIDRNDFQKNVRRITLTPELRIRGSERYPIRRNAANTEGEQET